VRVFPTLVGVFPQRSPQVALLTGLPHARGGVSNISCYPVSAYKSSPRSWGCFYTIAGLCWFSSVFPTLVGVFPPTTKNQKLP